MSKMGKNRVIYILMVTGLVWLYVTYIPFLMDYYVCRPEESFFEFFQNNLYSTKSDFESVLIAFLVVFLFCLSWNSVFSVGIVSLLLMILTHGSYVKYMNRKELLRVADLQLTEAAGMATEYLIFEWDSYLAALLIGFLLFVALGVGIEVIRRKVLLVKGDTQQREESKKGIVKWVKVGAVRLVTAGLVLGAGLLYTNQFLVSQMEMENADNVKLVNGEMNRYILYHFVKNDSLGNISVERVGESYEFLLAGEEARKVDASSVKPNVIVIMNESWWNTDNADLSKLELSKDPMEPFNRLADECVTGYLTSNVYGGGTISSEAEFLTGVNTKYYVSTSTVYEETLGKKLPSLADYFNYLNYETIAIHPYYGDFYNRREVYTTMGFDEMVFEEDMKNREVYARYISDDSLVKEIIAEYEEESDEENKFIWSVSIANHRNVLEYHKEAVENYDYPIDVTVKDGELSELETGILNEYINGIYLAGKSYEELIAYFSTKEEPVVIVMFGDHMPNFSMDALEIMGLTKASDPTQVDVTRMEEWQTELDAEKQAEADSIEMLKRIYSVPVVMWSNYEMTQQASFEGESIYYLPQMLLESAGLPDSDMSRMLKYQRSVFKANSREFVMDANGEQVLMCTEEQMEMLKHGKVVIYDILFGEEERGNVWNPIVTE